MTIVSRSQLVMEGTICVLPYSQVGPYIPLPLKCFNAQILLLHQRTNRLSPLDMRSALRAYRAVRTPPSLPRSDQSPSSLMSASSVAIAARGHCIFPAQSPLLRPLLSPMRSLLLHVAAATSVFDPRQTHCVLLSPSLEPRHRTQPPHFSFTATLQ